MRFWPLLLVLASCGAHKPSPPRAAAPTIAPAYAKWPVLLVREFDGLGLFRAESSEATAILADWARAQGLPIVDATRATEILDRAWRGEHATTGSRCGTPLSASEGRERWRKELGAGGSLRGSVTCDEARKCTLSVVALSGFDDDAETLAYWEAPFDARAPFAAELRKAVAALGAYEVAADGAMGGLGLGGLGGNVVADPERLTIDTWPAHVLDDDATFADALAVPNAMAALRGCFATMDTADVLVAADDKGRIARCESTNGNDDAAQCTCKVLASSGTVSGSARGKRFYVRVMHSDADVVADGKAVVRASVNTYLEPHFRSDGSTEFRPAVSDRSIAAWRPPRDHALAACSSNMTSGTLHFRVRTHFDAIGNAVSADVHRGPGEGSTEGQVKCLARAFLASRAPCPATANATADADVTITSRPIGAAIAP